MWFSPLKGAHLTLGQLDKTLPVDKSVANNQKIERGSFVFIQAWDGSAKISPRFALYTATEAAKANAVPYIALMGVNDFQAGMAGNVGQVEKAIGTEELGVEDGVGGIPTGTDLAFLGKKFTEGHQEFTGPRITAISVVQPAEYQTSAFDKTKTYYVGQPLTIDNGKLTPFTDGKNIVGYVTKEPFIRWVNDVGASEEGARISGGNLKVIEFSTAWIPVAAVEHKDAVAANPEATPPVEGSPEVPGTVGALNLKGEKADVKADTKADTKADAKGDTKPQGK